LIGCCRHACKAEREEVRLLSGAVHRHHVHRPHPSTHSVLRFQPHHSVCTHLIHGVGGVHSAARIRRENLARYVTPRRTCSACLFLVLAWYLYLTVLCAVHILLRLPTNACLNRCGFRTWSCDRCMPYWHYIRQTKRIQYTRFKIFVM